MENCDICGLLEHQLVGKACMHASALFHCLNLCQNFINGKKQSALILKRSYTPFLATSLVNYFFSVDVNFDALTSSFDLLLVT